MIRISTCFMLFASSLANASVNGDTIYYNSDIQQVEDPAAAIAFIHIDSLNNGLEFSRLYYLESDIVYGELHLDKSSFTGPYVLYHRNGTKSQSGQLKQNRYVGLQNYFDITGIFQRGDIYHYRKGLIGQFYFSQSGKKIYSIADRLGTFGKKRNEIKALTELGRFVNTHLEKPAVSNDYPDPKVLVSFLIAPNGNLEEIRVAEGLHPVLDSAAIKVIKEMPTWRPAKFKGKNVYSEFSISIRF